MFLEESIWIRDVLAKLELGKDRTVLNMGSGSEKFRCLQQPFIDYYIFRPLRERGIKVIHVDAQKEEGVDIACDLASPGADSVIGSIPPADVVLATNLLEHVPDRDLVLGRIKKLAKANGAIILTVPYLYHWHPAPIDTMYRPSNTELETLFPGPAYKKIASDIIEVEAEKVLAPLPVRMVNRICRNLGLPIYRPSETKNKVSVLAVRLGSAYLNEQATAVP